MMNEQIENGIVRKPIRKKIMTLMLLVSISAQLFTSIINGVSMTFISKHTDQGLEKLKEGAVKDSTSTVQGLTKEQLKSLAEDKAEIVKHELELIKNQTRAVAYAAADVFKNPEQYIQGRSIDALPLGSYDFSCNYTEEAMEKYCIQLLAPRELMKEESIQVEDGKVVKAELDLSAFTREQKRDLFLGIQADRAIGGIRNFDNGDGTYNLIGASYFALESSGVDILADLQTQKMIEYDARKSKWYTSAKKLKQGEIYWTDPVEDGAGRGISMICAAPVYDGDRLVGVAGSGGLIDEIREVVRETKIGESGYSFLINLNNAEGKMNIITNADESPDSEINQCSEDLKQSSNKEFKKILDRIEKKDNDIVQTTLNGEKCYLAFSKLKENKWAMVTVISLNDKSLVRPIDEMSGTINKKGDSVRQSIARTMRKGMFLTVILFVLIAAGIVWLSLQFSKRLTAPLVTLTEGAGRISKGDLDHTITVGSEDEMEILGNTFNQMTKNLKEYIRNLTEVTAEKERIGAELNVATQIQADMLPRIFPAFPERKEFDLYATMTPAKEVGGDFYDFFLIDDDHLALVMADVSGKGVPAALFMVIAKTLIKNGAQLGKTPSEVLSYANERLCEGNEAELFVTVWLGIIEISTGKGIAANAGHEHPAIKRADGKWELVVYRHSPAVATMEGMRFREHEFEIHPGDSLYVYTDGVAEATNKDNVLYGPDRMIDALNREPDAVPEQLLKNVKEDVDLFVGTAPQFDDITMLGLKWYGKGGEE